MAQRIANHVLSRTPFKPYIFRVDDLLRTVNEKAYEPAMVAIGPYHHGKKILERMEEHKSKYLQQLLQRRNESSVDKYVAKLRALEEEARSCYAEPISLDKDKFVEMMLVDGCFIIEFLRKTKMKELVDEDDPIFQIDRIKNILGRDLILFENQLPLFILVQLFNMTKHSDDHMNDMDIAEIALNFLGRKLPCSKGIQASTRVSIDNFDHLLGLMHHRWSPSFAEMAPNRNVGNQDKLQLIKSTTELERVGIKFRKAVNTSLFDIRFRKKIMKIPSITVNDETECLFRNLIAYEQYHQNFCQNYVTGYATFMNCLIDSAKDVEALRSYGIIENRLADDASVSAMFNKLCSNVAINRRKFCYSHVLEKVNDYRPGFLKKKYAELKYRLRDPLTFLNVKFSVVTIVLAAIQIMDLVNKS
ncbi:UPF0481 protein At3g47200-like [Cornus florida]|uniref:UPF0481 protein At3g47200-like n=1 Tax=Cornus florida TaxID=4283 RepID=UPI002897F89F|nr:UPF0481 protein At3g47200-like [Cornus florida]